ncbi:hypothetical protein EMCRGX_G003860 [Ephydatia muelleri]
MGFGYHKRGSILLSVSIRTGKYAGGTKMYFSFVRIWLVSTNKSITRGHTKLGQPTFLRKLPAEKQHLVVEAAHPTNGASGTTHSYWRVWNNSPNQCSVWSNSHNQLGVWGNSHNQLSVWGNTPYQRSVRGNTPRQWISWLATPQVVI